MNDYSEMQSGVVQLRQYTISAFDEMQRAQRRDTETMRRNMSTSLVGMQLKTAVVLGAMKNRTRNTVDKMKNTWSRINDSRLFNKLKQGYQAVSNKLSSSTKALVSKLASASRAVIGKVFTSAKSIVGGIAGIASSAFSTVKDYAAKALEEGLNFEKKEMTIDSIIKIKNQDKTTKELSKMQKDYKASLKVKADQSPFAREEVMDAGTEAIKMTGDVDEAMKLVELAQNMVGMNPTKSLEEAMSALGALNDGKKNAADAMGDFGIDIGLDEKALKADGAFDNLVSSKLEPAFKGGVDQLSKTTGGMMSQIKTRFQGSFIDFGGELVQSLQPLLDKVIVFMESPSFNKFMENIQSGIGGAMEAVGEVFTWATEQLPPLMASMQTLFAPLVEFLPIIGESFNTIFTTIQENIGGVKAFISEAISLIVDNFGWIAEEGSFLTEVFTSVFSAVKEVLSSVWKVAKPFIGYLANGIRLVFNIFKLVWPYLRGALSGLWKVLQPVIDALAKAYELIGGFLGKAADWVGNLANGNKKDKKNNKPAIDGSHALGLRNVPFDGYIAELHKGEAVIPASQNPYASQNLMSDNTQINNKSKSIGKIDINIFASDRSSDEIVADLVPKLEIALMNI